MPKEKPDKPAVAPQVPPHNRDAEQAVLGAMLFDERAIGESANSGLTADDFYDEAHRRIFAACLRVGKADLLLVCDELKMRGEIESVGGATYLSQLLDITPSVANVKHYIGILKRHRWLRDLASLSTDIATTAYSANPDDAEAVLNEAVMKLLVHGQDRASGFVPLGTLIQPTLDHIEAVREHKVTPAINIEMLPILQEYLGGLYPGELTIVEGRASVGKSAFVWELMLNAALMQGKRSAIFTMEMAAQMLTLRAIGRNTGFGINKLRAGRYHKEDFDAIQWDCQELMGLPIFIDDSAGIALADLITKATYVVTTKKIDLLVIDYLQLIRKVSFRQSEAEHLSECSKGIKSLARNLGVPTLLLSSLNREGQLRGSGQMEYDTDNRLLLESDTPDDIAKSKQCTQFPVEIRIIKNRNGPLGSQRTMFVKHTMSFTPAYEPEEPAARPSAAPRATEPVKAKSTWADRENPEPVPAPVPAPPETDSIPF